MDRTTDPSRPDAKPGILINRNFALLWSGQAISVVGDFVFDTVILLWIATRLAHGQSWAPLAVSGVLIAASVPMAVLGPLAGVFVDRWDKRRTMLRMDALRALLILCLFPAAGLVHLSFLPNGSFPRAAQLTAIYTVVVLSSICAQFFDPSRIALLGDIVEDAQRARASGLSQITRTLAMIAGPPIAAPLFVAFGVEWALLLNALSFAGSFLAILAVRAPRSARSVAPGEAGNVLRELREGLRFFRGNRVLMTVLIAAVIIMLGAGSLNALDIFFVTQNLHAPAAWFGLLGAVMGAGALGGAILAGVFAERIGVARAFWASVLVTASLILVYSRLTAFGPALLVLFLGGVFEAALNVALSPLVLRVTPRELVGRVAAVIMPAVSLATLVSIVLAGYLDSTLLRGFHATLLGMTFGPVDTIFSGAGVLGIAGGLYAMINLRGTPTTLVEETRAVADVTA